MFFPAILKLLMHLPGRPIWVYMPELLTHKICACLKLFLKVFSLQFQPHFAVYSCLPNSNCLVYKYSCPYPTVRLTSGNLPWCLQSQGQKLIQIYLCQGMNSFTVQQLTHRGKTLWVAKRMCKCVHTYKILHSWLSERCSQQQAFKKLSGAVRLHYFVSLECKNTK